MMNPISTMASITSLKVLPEEFILQPDEREFFRNQRSGDLAFRTTAYYFSLINIKNPDDPIRKQCLPSSREHNKLSVESSDPLAEKLYSPLPRLIHRYPSRVLIRLTGVCAMHCRFCYRRELLDHETAPLEREDFQNILKYIQNQQEINEVLISGGDPLTLPNDVLEYYFSTLRKAAPHVVIRLCTRIPVVQPLRIDADLVGMLKKIKGLWVVTHYNHPRELTDISCEKIALLKEAGITILNQSVLLKGINDREEILLQLFRKLSHQGIKPYYLFQTDLARGTTHFRVDLKRGINLYGALQKKLSQLMLPVYALDLPQGGGKIQLNQNSIIGKENDFYLLSDQQGRSYCYPVAEQLL
ncbi:MAG: KamA family radical SAM protein [Spirochaetales bacterium]|nr:KamA family radical SAM protein [Spirochaetales bacterium]